GERLLPVRRVDDRRSNGLEPGGERRPERRELDPAADEREHAEYADRPAHREWALLAVVRMEVLPCVGVGLAGEDDEEEAERVDAGEQRAELARDEDDVAVPPVVERRCEDRVLGEEAGERWDADERERADQEHES